MRSPVPYVATFFALAIAIFAGTVALGHASDGPGGFHVDLPFRPGETSAQAVRRLQAAGENVAGVNLEERVVVVETRTPKVAARHGKPLAVRVLPTAPDPRWRTYDEVVEYLRLVVEKYPRWTKLEEIGRTGEGRAIYALRLRAPGVADGPRKSVYFDALHHAREVATPDVVLDIVEQLVTTACRDAASDARKYLTAFDVWVVPMVNPDGSAKVWRGSSMWRKNNREGYGVDINRNYPEEWARCGGSSGNRFDDTYRGPSAGSEPETQAILRLGDRIKPIAAITYHSFSEMVLYPMGCRGERVPSADRGRLEGLGKRMASALLRDSGNGTYAPGTPWELLYSVDGDANVSWYLRHGTLAYTIEVSSSGAGFQPPAGDYRESLLRRQRPAWKILLDEALRSTR